MSNRAKKRAWKLSRRIAFNGKNNLAIREMWRQNFG